MATLTFDGDDSGLLEAVERSRRAVERLEAEVAAKKFPLGSAESDRLAEQLDRARRNAARLNEQIERMRTPISRWDSNVRAAEAAGRIFGGRLGEITGIMGDFSDVVENGLSPTGAIALAITGVGVAAVGAVAGTVALTRAAIDLANETDQMNGDLLEAEQAMNAVDDAATQLTINLGTRTAGAVASMSFALTGLIDATEKTVDAVGDSTPEGLGSVLAASYAVALPKTAAAVYALSEAYGSLEERGRRAAEQQERVALGLSESDMLNALGLFEDPAAAAGRERAQLQQQRQAEQARAEARRLAEEARRERERELAEMMDARQSAHDFTLRLQREEASETARLLAETKAIQFKTLAEVQAEEDAANADRVEKARATAAELAASWQDAYDAQRAAAFSVADSLTGLLGDLVSENRDASIAIFATRKALAVAEIAVNTAVAASRAVAELGPIAGPPVAAGITAAGVAQGIAVGAMAIGEGISTFGQAQQAQTPTINATLVVEGQPIRNGVRTRRVGQR